MLCLERYQPRVKHCFTTCNKSWAPFFCISRSLAKWYNVSVQIVTDFVERKPYNQCIEIKKRTIENLYSKLQTTDYLACFTLFLPKEYVYVPFIRALFFYLIITLTQDSPQVLLVFGGQSGGEDNIPLDDKIPALLH